MRQNTINSLKKSMGNGKVKILLGPYSIFFDSFVEKSIKNVFDSERIVFFFNKDYPKDYLFKYLIGNIVSGGLYIISHITNFDNIIEIINYFSGRSDIDLVCSSDLDLANQLGDNSTLVRGRVQNILFQPFLYEDYLESGTTLPLLNYVESTNNNGYCFGNYKYANQAEKMYKKLNKYIGLPVSFRGMFESDFDVSINTFVSIFNYLTNHGFLYTIRRMDIKKMDLLPNYLYCYPSFVSVITSDNSPMSDKTMRLYETLIIAKLIYENCLVYKAVYRNSENEIDSAYTNTFVVFKNNKNYFLKLFFNNTSEESLNKYRNTKTIYPRVVLLLDDIETYVEKNGAIFMSVKNYLMKGFNYGGI